MTFKTDEDVILLLKQNKTIPKWVTDAQKYSAELCALVEGECFSDELIDRIEQIESLDKAKVRKKYARDIAAFFERLFLPIQNVFSSTGGVKSYKNGSVTLSDANQKRLLETVSNIRDNKSIERYIETQWLSLYHTDPSGVLWMRYKVENDELDIYPTYQSIGSIRNYKAKGQLVEWIIFEPTVLKEETIWIVVDDLMQRTIIQRGDAYTIDTDPLKTFKHPFGIVPVIINSNLTDKLGNRLSPIHKIIPTAKEFARDQSIKTLYKFLHGFPKHWRRAMICKSCGGSRKSGNNACGDCNGKGEILRIDVADEAIMPMPETGDPVLRGEDVMGYTSPDIETWKQFNEELDRLENECYETMWGTQSLKQVQKTATEIHYDMQPQINKLNKYADVAEWIEWTITEWCANAIDTTKKKDEQISLIVYGRRYILEGIDTIQKKYEDAKAAGENSVVLDGIFDELLTVKFKNDPEWMAIELKKARTEPYLHNSVNEIYKMFGAEEAARKIYFQKWWKKLSDAELTKQQQVLEDKFNADFQAYLPTLKIKPTTQITNTTLL